MRFITSLFVFAALAEGVFARHPNLLIIQTDEHNFRTLGCYRERLPAEQAFVWGPGVAVETPHIDWIAKNGALAERFYAVSPVCTPSRASFMTGRYPQNTGAMGNNLPMRDDMVTFAEVLRRKGYATGYAGKWHLDGDGRPQFAPQRRFGWEDNRYMFNRGHWKNLVEDERGPRVGAVDEKGQPTYALAGADEKSFTTDFLADRTIDFIRKHHKAPFCYMVSIPDPHGPNYVRPPYDTMYLDLPFQPPVSASQPGERLPAYAAKLQGKFVAREMSQYFGMVKCIDDNVGRILDVLREVDVLENTIIVFTSDHGDMCGEHGRQNKGNPMEASARVPFLVHAPGRVKPGTVVSQALTTVDFKPTILKLLGIKNPDRDEGRDASALFRSAKAAKSWHDVTFVRIGSTSSGISWMAAFTKRYKLVVAPYANPSLFDVEGDPNEMTNLWFSPAHREIVRTLASELVNYAQTHAEPLYTVASVQADLAWAISGTGEYTPPTRGKPSTRDDSAE
jgi:arylsulfatase A-like enzyme